MAEELAAISDRHRQAALAIQARLRRGVQAWVEAGVLLLDTKAELGHGQWLPWLRECVQISESSAVRLMRIGRRFKSVKLTDLPIELSAMHLLTAPATPEPVVREALERAARGEPLSYTRAKRLLNQHRGVVTLADYRAQPPTIPATPSAVALPMLPTTPADTNGHTPTFNRVNEMIDWAKWSWNPVTGCLHDCSYCYARDIAERFYPEKFAPTFHPERLKAPHATKLPPEADDGIGWRNVFVCSMADLFGKWVPQAWIDAVLAEVRAAPQWNFLFLTKFPQRLAEIEWPENAWVGTTVDKQYRVSIAEKAFQEVQATVKWLSCEPLLEDLSFSSLAMFDWVVMGGQSESSRTPAFQPPWAWVDHLLQQIYAANALRRQRGQQPIKLYWKPNLAVRPQEYPGAKLTGVGAGAAWPAPEAG
jgi:protein gp37